MLFGLWNHRNFLINDLEIKPLSVTASICIVLQPQVVFVVAHFRRFTQVSILKSRIKHKHIWEVGYELTLVKGVMFPMLAHLRHMFVQQLFCLIVEVSSPRFLVVSTLLTLYGHLLRSE